MISRLICAIVLLPILASSTPAVAAVSDQLSSVVQTLQGKRLGLVINAGSCDESGRADLDFFIDAKGTTITAFFAPEHGIRNDIPYGEKVTDMVDPVTSLPVYAIYTPRHAPSAEQLKNVDALVYDLTDVGVRFWTFTWAMTYCMEAAAEAKIPFYVIDRPNPINGEVVEGSPNTEDYALIGRVAKNTKMGVATRHGMTLGEIATWWNAEHLDGKVDLHVVRMTDWKRSQYWDEMGGEFCKRSPNLRTLDTAIVYPGNCIFEGSNISEGRATDAPYEMVGAPFIDGEKWADTMNAMKLPGTEFKAVSFTPVSSKFKGELCHGITLKVTDRTAYQPIRTAFHMLKSAVALHPNDAKLTTYAARLMGVTNLETRLIKETPEAIIAEWDENLVSFNKVREKYLLYK